MAWTAPRTWTAGDALTDSLMNEQLKNNLNVLKNPPRQTNNISAGVDYTTNSTSFVNVSDNAATFKVEITTTELSDIMVGGTFSIECSDTSTTRAVDLDITRNGTSVTGGLGFLLMFGNTSQVYPIPLFYIVKDVPAGTHIFRLQWRIGGSTNVAKIAAAARRFQFWARELS